MDWCRFAVLVGNLQTQAIRIGSATSLSQSYTYDSVNRLLSASEGANWSQTYGYDSCGNRWVSAGAGYGNTPALTSTAQTAFNAADNRLSGTGYDASGNLTTDLTGRSFAYDAENRQVSYNGGSVTVNASYDYDGEGRRVWRIQNGVTTVFVYNGQGQLAAEYSSQAAAGPGGTSYVMADHLGSTRLVTNADGTVRGRHDYLPFGEEIGTSYGGRSAIAGYGATDLRHKFTAKERDSESNLDYFGARYFSGAQGRFTSADEPLVDQDVRHPQSWNLYAYVRNNPLRFRDPRGRACVSNGNGGWIDDDSGGQTCAEVEEENRKRTANITVDAKKDDVMEELDEVTTLTTGPTALVIASTAIAVADSPIPGPADLLALGILSIGSLMLPSPPAPSIFLSESKHNKEVLAGLLATAQVHLERLQSAPPEDPNRRGWKKEIKAALDRAKRVADRLVGKAKDEAIKAIEYVEKAIQNE
ncbi:MAG: RHS repeat-associated core domain-containing protein [Acidobacteriota bacterium]